MSDWTAWAKLAAEIIAVLLMLWWAARKKDWARVETEKAKIKDQAETKAENQAAQEALDDAEAKNNADRDEILKG